MLIFFLYLMKPFIIRKSKVLLTIVHPIKVKKLLPTLMIVSYRLSRLCPSQFQSIIIYMTLSDDLSTEVTYCPDLLKTKQLLWFKLLQIYQCPKIDLCQILRQLINVFFHCRYTLQTLGCKTTFTCFWVSYNDKINLINDYNMIYLHLTIKRRFRKQDKLQYYLKKISAQYIMLCNILKAFDCAGRPV